MYSFDKLSEAVGTYKEQHGEWPTVVISSDFWEQHAHGIADLSNKGVEITVSEGPYIKGFYFANIPRTDEKTINTVRDLKEQAQKLIDEGLGHWPVKFLPHDARVYLQIKLCPIIPGQAPAQGLELHSHYADAPEGEHVLILFGQDTFDE